MGVTRRTSKLGKYHLVAELARGGMGDVHLALIHGPAGFGKLVVVKELRPGFDDAQSLAWFLDEARLAARLNHPNIVQTYEVGSVDGRHFLAMEYLEGQNLRSLLLQCEKSEAGRKLPLPMHLRILIDVLAGLHHAHELRDYEGRPLGIVHRDVSPHNVFVTYEGQTKLLDFGIAKANDSTQHTTDGVIRGKVAYMAPEQVRGDKADRRADVFAVGIMLWEALYGRRMWEGLSDLAIIHRLASGEIPQGNPELSETSAELHRICRKALAPDPAQRYATAEELQTELEGVLLRQGRIATPRALGAIVGELFQEERARATELIEGRIREIRGELDRAEAFAAHDGEALDEDALEADTQDNRASETAEFAAKIATTSDVVPTLSSSVSPISSSALGGHATQSAIAAFLRPRRTAWVAAGVSSVVALAVVLGIAARKDTGSGSAQTHAAGVETTGPHVESPASDLAPTSFKVVVRANPSTARVFIDGAEVTNPYEGRVPHDARTHVIRVEAPGYEATEEEVAFDKDLAVHLALEKTTVKASAASPPTGAGRAAWPTPGGAPAQPATGTRKFKGALDPDNPYRR